jgi:hypothetical protein
MVYDDRRRTSEGEGHIVLIRSLGPCAILTILVGLAAFPGHLYAQSQHRACNTSDPPLARGEPGVVADDQAFVRNNRSYEFTIFGLGAANPEVTNKPYEICLRYEFKNRGKEAIQELSWKDAGVAHLSYVQPGEQIKWRPPDKSSDTMQTDTGLTELHAFENAQATGRTVFSLEQRINRSPPGQSSSGASSRYSLLQSFPELSSQLTEARASGDAVLAYYSPRGTFGYRTLNVAFESQGVAISIQSTVKVSLSDRFASVNGEIRVASKMEGPVAVYAPGLTALQKAGFASEESVRDRSATFLKLLAASTGPLASSGPVYATSVGFRTPSSAGTPSLFVVEHPVTITVGAWSACLMAKTYSPVPVTLSEAHCRAR